MDLDIDSAKATKKIERFIQQTLSKTRMKRVIIASSGGIDSSTAATLTARAIGKENTFLLLLPYKDFHKEGTAFARQLSDFLHVPKANTTTVEIAPLVDEIAKTLSVDTADKIRFGNIIARVRMIVLYDFAKKHDALVCGTENKSEYYLGYFTRFGDEASDFEPLRHLYKTQVYQLAGYLQIPQDIRRQAPTAGLWVGQTDEKQFGFSYKEADQVLCAYYDKKRSVEDIQRDFPNAQEVIAWSRKNAYKHHVPYTIES